MPKQEGWRMRMGLCGILTLTLSWLLAESGLTALYVRVEAERVPVARLLKNLEKDLAANPADPLRHVNLARLHGMVWALKSEDVPADVNPKSGKLEPWYGYEPHLVPYGRDVRSGSPEAQEVARKHLEASLEHYRAALELAPDNLLAMLGYGWTLEQGGSTAEAIEQYRAVIARAWPSEKQATTMGRPGRRFFTNEAAEYLIPLLDRPSQAKEVEDLRSMQPHFERLPRAVTPLAIPLRTDLPGSQIHDRTARVRFDADGSGLRREWTWIGPHAGWLVHDSGRRGDISSALQLFGNVTFWLFWDNGYEALSALDDNGDGEIAGVELRELAIWLDANLNGISEPGEVRSIDAYGITALSCDFIDGDGAEFAAISLDGMRLRDGETRPTYDVILRSSPPETTALDPPPSPN